MWRFVLVDGMLGHYVPDGPLAVLLRDELVQRSHDRPAADHEEAELAGRALGDIRFDDPRDHAWVELGGMCLANAADWACPDTGFQCPARDFEVIEAKLQTAPLRTFADGTEYYKVHGWRSCVVLAPGLRDTVLANMAADHDAAVTVGKADADRFEEAKQRAVAAGVLVRPGPIGGDWS